jgi:hypothetical protein
LTSHLTAAGSSPPAAASANGSANGKKRGGLSDAAKQAIRDAAKSAETADEAPEGERASKKIKLDGGSAKRELHSRRIIVSKALELIPYSCSRCLQHRRWSQGSRCSIETSCDRTL